MKSSSFYTINNFTYYILLLAIVTTNCKTINDYCKLNVDHTMCQFEDIGEACGNETESISGVTPSEAREIVNIHNFFRAKIAKGLETRGAPGPQPSAANMNALVWDDDLASVAQRWADQCTNQHDKCRNDARFAVGQNIIVTMTASTTTDWRTAITTWYKEVAQFNSNNITEYQSSDVTSNYTQLIWAKTKYIGCGQMTFGDPYVLPDSYRPPTSPIVYVEENNDDPEYNRGKRQDPMGFFGGAHFDITFAKGSLGKYIISMNSPSTSTQRPSITTTKPPQSTTSVSIVTQSTVLPTISTNKPTITTTTTTTTPVPPQQSETFITFDGNNIGWAVQPINNQSPSSTARPTEAPNKGSFISNIVDALFGINRKPKVTTTTTTPSPPSIYQPSNVFEQFYPNDEFLPLMNPINNGFYPNDFLPTGGFYPNGFYPNPPNYYPQNPSNHPIGGFYQPDNVFYPDNSFYPDIFYPNHNGYYPNNNYQVDYPNDGYYGNNQQYYYPNHQGYNFNEQNEYYGNFQRTYRDDDETRPVRSTGSGKVPLIGRNQILVCNYGPAGNIADEPIYTSGLSCSQCPSDTTCKNGLCF